MLLVNEVQNIGTQPAYGLMDLAGGCAYERHPGAGGDYQSDRSSGRNCRASLRPTRVNDNQPYIIPAQPRTIYLKFGQKF